MIAKSSISFAAFQQFLVELGFTAARRGKAWYFEHSPSETAFLFRPYRAMEKVTLVDFQSTRRHLDLRGLINKGEFDDRFRQATA